MIDGWDQARVAVIRELLTEIDRLHAELTSARTVERKDLHARITALTTELGAALTEHEAMRVENEAMTERFVPLVEENERLRAALTDLVNETDWVQFEWKGQVAWDRAARLALAAHPAATGEG